MYRDSGPQNGAQASFDAYPRIPNFEHLSSDFHDLPPLNWPEQWQPSVDFPTPQSVSTGAFEQIVNDGLSYKKPEVTYRLGECDLPVAPFREHFVRTVANYQSVVVSSETGSGKSSQLGLYLLEAGAPRVFVTQPRIVAARELHGRAQQNLGERYAPLAGYLTGNASDSDCGPDARLIYVTEQLLFKMANRGKLNPDDIVILDEAHERTAAMVILLGLMKAESSHYPAMRLIVSSATMDTDKFANYLADRETGSPAPVLILPGRTHPITRLDSDEGVSTTMRKHMQNGSNVLAFEPGVARMKTTWAKARSRMTGHTIHMLYGDQSPNEQSKALTPEDKNHVIATRIGETSITPQGKDVVVDSGLSNVGRYVEGVRGLETEFSSQATIAQRAGRIGRTKPGTYILAVPADTTPPPAFEDRQVYDDPAIQNSSMTSFIAELLGQGRRLEDLDLIEDPTEENLRHDYLVLRRIGALALIGDEVVLTSIGEAMNDLPLDAPLARMVVEARNIAREDDDIDYQALRLQVAAIAAIQQVKGILSTNHKSMVRKNSRKSLGEPLSNEQSSDLLYELDVFTALMSQQIVLFDGTTSDEMAQFDALLAKNEILANRYYKALRTFEEICRREQLEILELEQPNQEQRRLILDCQLAGTEELFVQRSHTSFIDIRGNRRKLGRKSIIAATDQQLIMGTAFNLIGMRSTGRNPRLFITGASAISPERVQAIASHRLSERSLGYVISRAGVLVEKKAYFFDGELSIGEYETPASPTIATREALITAMMTGTAPGTNSPRDLVSFNPGTPNATDAAKQWKQAQKLENISDVNLNITKRYKSLIKRVIRQSLESVPLDVTSPEVLDDLIPKVFVNGLVRPTRRKDIPEIVRKSPDGIAIHVEEGVDSKEYIPVTYRNSIAYITISRDMRFAISRDDFAELLKYHDIKMRIGSGKYLQFEAAFTKIDEQRFERDSKRAKRELNRALKDAAAAASVGVPVKGVKRPIKEPKKEAQAKMTNSRTLSSRQRRGMGRRSKSLTFDIDE